jgi:hypothetical protein
VKQFIALGLSALFLLSACQTQVPPIVNISEPEQLVSSERENTTTHSSSELEGETGYGFAYNAANVLDIDYSTAWCSSGKDSLPSFSLDFSENVHLGTVGIMPGFARDEAIFKENNRLKTVEVWYDDQPEALAELNFTDEYAMQFFDLPEEAVQKLHLKIMETYPGSKYDDTCISEIDFWSDWVNTKDSNAAYNRPISIESGEILLANSIENVETNDILNACGSFDESVIVRGFKTTKGHTNLYEGIAFLGNYLGNNQWSGWAGLTPVLSAKVSGAKKSDEFEIRWLNNDFPGMQTNAPKTIVRSVNVNPKNCGGELYISDNTQEPLAGKAEVQIFYKNKLLWRADISLGQ